MTAMVRGSHVISCRQIEVDGLRLRRPADLAVGAAWRWTGEAVEIGEARDLPLLAQAVGEVDLRWRAARQVRRMLAPVLEPVVPTGIHVDIHGAPHLAEAPDGTDGVLTLSDGYRSYTAVLLGTGEPRCGYAVFAGRMPPGGVDMRVTGLSLRSAPTTAPCAAPGFLSGTPIATDRGARRVETLRPGDLIETRDGAPKPLLWIGRRDGDAGSAVRLKPNLFGPGKPLAPVALAPGQGVLVWHPAARRLFGSDEVLVSARDLVEPGFARFCGTVGPEFRLLLEGPELIWAGGVPCASVHAAALDMRRLPDDQRLALVGAAPDLYRDPARHGPPARRPLSGAEAALLFHTPGVERLGV